jgi:hypothetical protein
MWQHDYNGLIRGKEQRFNMPGMEEVIPRYKFVSPFYYEEKHEDEELKKKFIIKNLIFIMWLNKEL